LREYFDPPPAAGGPIRPTEGHRALAALCVAGRVRVIMTTNFDRLLERALADAGVAPQVIATAEDLNGMTPLVHAAATVIKVNGD
jgi:NAD-dependent SIR2 family protein deacetylase